MLFVNPDAHSNKDLPNLALSYAATYFNTRVVDYNTMPEPADRLYSMETDILGVSFQSISYSHAHEINNNYKKTFPEAQIKSISGFLDIQCCYPFLQWNDTIAFDKPFSDDLPFPDYERFDSFPIFYRNWKSNVWPYPIITSLGCPFSCTFCMCHNRKLYSRSPENCYNELMQAKEKWRIKSFTIIDDCFNLKKKRVIEFCKAISSLNLEWLCTNGLRADCFDEEQAKVMADSGCSTVGFGIESSDPSVLQEVKKGETIEQIELAIKTAKKYFKSVSGFFIIGLPGSSYETDMQTLKWALQQGIYIHFSYYVPFDESMQLDKTFYGDDITPISKIYQKEQQEKMYNFSTGLSWGGINRDVVKVVKNRLKLLLKFGPYVFLKYALLDFKKFLNKISLPPFQNH